MTYIEFSKHLGYRLPDYQKKVLELLEGGKFYTVIHGRSYKVAEWIAVLYEMRSMWEQGKETAYVSMDFELIRRKK